jgi:hypothetical protein
VDQPAATAASVAFVGVPGLTLEADTLHVLVNRASTDGTPGRLQLARPLTVATGRGPDQRWP